MTIPIKNKESIVKMREACAIAATVLENLKPLVRPGVTTQDLEEAGRDWIARLGARSACYGYQHGSRRYPAHTCICSDQCLNQGRNPQRQVRTVGARSRTVLVSETTLTIERSATTTWSCGRCVGAAGGRRSDHGEAALPDRRSPVGEQAQP